jgi:RNA polymerase sigma-70 factor (ECF subfamily)
VSALPQVAAVAEDFRAHERFLWALCYRLVGSAADADDLVQETFLRALERPPARRDEPVRPWLVTVALNLGRDALRRRRRRAYTGPWLPEPIDTDEPPSWELEGERGTEGRYDLLESVSFAFLLALEALTPQQRAVLLLRDVFDYSVRETAAALALTEPNVKTTHHRARRALEPYEAHRCRPTPALAARSEEALARFLQGLASQDVAAVEAMLAADARAVSDGGGAYVAALRPIVGRDRVARFLLSLARHTPADMRFVVRSVNGLPALVVEQPRPLPRTAPRYLLRCELDAAGRVAAVHIVLAPAKLGRVRAVAG